MTPDELVTDVEHEVSAHRRRFAPGLFISIIDLFLALDVPGMGATAFTDVLARHPRIETLPNGNRANTLVLRVGNRQLSLRPFYNAIEKFIKADNKRFGYPGCAPHATQAWGDYHRWLDALSVLTRDQLDALRARVLKGILDAYPSHEFEPGSVRAEPALFEAVLQNFELTAQAGEPTGAAYQGVVFGFLRADNPHLQVEVDKVRVGSKRLQRVGDIDGWDGGRLAVTAEVKQYDFPEEDVDDLAGFAGAVEVRGSIGLVVALGFGEGVRDKLRDQGLHPLDKDDLLQIVALWDPVKQRIAISSMLYFFEHVEKNKSLTDRLTALIASVDKPTEEKTAWTPMRPKGPARGAEPMAAERPPGAFGKRPKRAT